MSIIDRALKKTQTALQDAQSISPRQKRIPFLRYFLIIGTAGLCAVAIHITMLWLPTIIKSSAAKSTASQSLVLNGTINANNKHLAFINSQSYTVGQSVGGFEILGINDGSITLFDPNTKQTKTLTTTFR